MTLGIVKEVASGDTLTVMGRAAGGPPPEVTLTLSGINAPRLGRRDGSTPDEPFAWASREALRRACIGQQVSFEIEGGGAPPKQEGGRPQRTFAKVQLVDAPANGSPRDLSLFQVTNGLARAKAPRRDAPQEDDGQSLTAQLLAAEEASKSAGEGVWSSDAQAVTEAVRDTSAASTPSKDLLDTLGRDPQRAVVEYVHSGHNLRVTFLPSFASAMVTLSGVTCPPPNGAEGPAPFALEARFFTECRVLSRDVAIALEGVDRHGNLFGTVRYAGGNIAEEILAAGLGKVATWSIGACGAAAALRAAEKKARDARVRVWQSYVPAVSTLTAPSGTAREYEARVVEVSSPDTLVVSAGPGAAEQQVRLSNLRVPRMGRRDERPAPHAWEAREYVRKRLIGRKVRVFVDYVKPAADGFPERTCVTVFTDKGTNIAEALVKAGLATVAKLRPDHEERSLKYDDLLAAEANAEAEKRGMHSPKTPAVPHLNDVNNQAKAKSFLPSLQRQRRIAAVVEHVFNGARVKVTVPKESCSLLISVAGVRSPQVPRPGQGGGEAPKGAVEALNFTRHAALHRDVELEVFDCDKSGAIIAAVHVEGRNLSEVLAEQGLATTSYADRLPFADTLYEAEERAKQRRIGVWEGYTEPVPAATAVDAVDAGGDAASAQKEITVRPVEVLSGTSFACHVLPKGTSPASIEAKIKAATRAGGDGPIRKNALVVAPFAGAPYRGKITAVSPSGAQCQVTFIDYGNTDVVDTADLKPLDPASIKELPAQSQTVHLAGLRDAPEVDEGIAEAAGALLAKLVYDKQVRVKVTGRTESGAVTGVVEDTESGLCVNNAMVRAGLAIVTGNRGGRKGRGGQQRAGQQQDSEFEAKLREDQEIARQARLNAWRYGDVDDEDED